MTASATPLVTPLGTPVLTRATSGSVTGTWGTGQNRVAGNVLVAAVSAGAVTSAAAISTPAGWIQYAPAANTTGTANARVAFYVRTAAGGDAAPAFTSTLSGTGAMTCTLFELAGGNALTPANTYGTYASGGTAGTLSSMLVTTATPASQPGGYAISCFAQEAAAAANTWNGAASPWSNAVSDGTTSSVVHTAVDVQAGPASGAQLTEAGHWTTDASAFGCAAILVIAPTGPGIELYANDATTTVTSGGSDTPAAGTVEIWTVASPSGFPVVSLAAFPPVKFHIADTSATGYTELIAVLSTSSTTWTVVRGAEGTTPVSHSSG